MRQINDGQGKMRGFLTESSSQKAIHDSKGKKLGYYSMTDDVTYNAQGRRVGRGNQLMTLLN